MLRKIVLAIAFLYFAALVLFAVLLFQGRPAATGLTEIGFGEWQSEEGFVYISGRRLSCGHLSGADHDATRCTVPIAGSLLTITATPVNLRPTHFEGACQAHYRGQLYLCRPDVRSGTVRPIALIESTLDLSLAEREALRTHYWAENGRFPSLHILATISTLVALAAAVAWKPPHSKTRQQLAAYGCITSFAFIFFNLLLFTATSYLWD